MTQSEIDKAAEEWLDKQEFYIPLDKPETLTDVLKTTFSAGAEYAKQEERFRIVQLLANLPEVSIENTTWGEIARLIEAPEAEGK